VDAVVPKVKEAVTSGTSPTILILDDQETARQHLRVLLSSAKEIIGEVKILESADIPTALRILSSTPVHVLLHFFLINAFAMRTGMSLMDLNTFPNFYKRNHIFKF
jgi:hypothetical protein